MSTNIGWSSPAIPPQKLLSPLVLNLGAEVMNFPNLEKADGAQPQWWTKSANCTLTEEDIAGESGLTETYSTRTLKVVTTANSSYAYQRYTYADQPRVKSGRSVAMLVAVWSLSGIPARVSLYSSVGFLAQSLDTTVPGWTILEIPQTTINGTYVDVRYEVDTGTAYFVPLTPWPRPLNHISCESQVVRTMTGSNGDGGFADRDLTSLTSNLTVWADLRVDIFEAVSEFFYQARRNGSSVTGGDTEIANANPNSRRGLNSWRQWLDDQQIYEEFLNRSVGSTTLDFGVLYLHGWEEWS